MNKFIGAAVFVAAQWGSGRSINREVSDGYRTGDASYPADW